MKDRPLSGKKSAKGHGKLETTCFICGRELTDADPGTGVVFVECAYCKVIWDYYHRRRKNDHGV
jgi:hypothetical protein